MKSFTALLATLLTFIAYSSTQDYNQSAPFALVLLSDDAAYNGTALVACHEGAAIEGLCTGSALNDSQPPYYIFQFNTSTEVPVQNYTFGTPGVLTYTLHGTNLNESEPMSLAYDPATNVAPVLFEPGYPNLYVAFDSSDRLNVPSYSEKGDVGLYHWYICETDLGYKYETVVWVLGSGPPEATTCCKVDLIRVTP